MTQLIKKILLSTFVLLVIYTLYSLNVAPDVYSKQEQSQENAIKVQRYLFGATPSSVIVGSSLSAKLTNVLPDYYNLAFSGQGNLDGLHIILRKDKLPDTVFIEMNTLLVPENKTFVDNMTNPVLNVVRKNVLPFREGKQPLPIVVTGFSNAIKSVRGGNVKGANSRTKSLANQLLAAQLKKYSISPSTKILQTAINDLKRFVDALEARKVTVVFFELPVHPKLCGLPLNQSIRSAFFNVFPQQRYNYLAKPDCTKFITTDGIHFTAGDATKYARYFNTELASLNARRQTLKTLDNFFK